MRLGKHIAVVGAGVVGLATALRLRREGYRVTLFDPADPGTQASAGNAGLIMTAHATPLSQRGMWRRVPGMLKDPLGPLVIRRGHRLKLLPWFRQFLKNSKKSQVETIGAALAPMVTHALEAWLGLLNPSEAARLLRQDGLLYVYQNRRNLYVARKEAAFRARFDIPSDIISAEGLREMEPALGKGLAGGVFYPSSAHCVDPRALCASVLSAFRTSGGEVKRTQVLSLSPSLDGVTLVTDEGEFAHDEVVVAAGIWSASLVKPLGVKAMLAPERGYHLMLRHPGITLRRPIAAGDHKFIISPLSGGIRLAGTAEFAAVNATPDWQRADILLPLAQRLMPNLTGETTATRWMGVRPSTPDSLPLVGRISKHPRVICAFGHSHFGLTLGAVTAGQVADIIAGRDPDLPIEALDPARF